MPYLLCYYSISPVEIKDKDYKISLKIARRPKINISSNYIFAKEDRYFVYQNNYNQFVNYYNETFQHGGISLEEMIIPVATYSSR